MTDNTYTLEFGQDSVGQRWDAALAKAAPQHTRSKWQQMMQAGLVSLANGVALTQNSAKIKSPCVVYFMLPETPPMQLVPEDMALDILFEDDHILVLNKPVGLVVHPGAGRPLGTLVQALLHHTNGQLSGRDTTRPGIVHRLDRDTSGAMVVAKTDQAHAHLVAQLQARTVKRTYHALVWGVPQPRVGTVQTQFGRSTTHRQKMAVKTKGGKEAITHYEVQKSYSGLASLVHCHLATGRTHQIRVHMAYLGHPLLGDKTYSQSTPRGTKNFAQQVPAALKEKLATLPGQMLHAAALSLVHPISGEVLQFNAPEPASFAQTANLLLQIL